jgi:transposase InsO family protein
MQLLRIYEFVLYICAALITHLARMLLHHEPLSVWNVVTTLEREVTLSKRALVTRSEFISKVLDQWAYLNGVALDFSRFGEPTDNAFIEACNGRLRQERLNENWFLSRRMLG